jgi:hypothetical protein
MLLRLGAKAERGMILYYAESPMLPIVDYVQTIKEYYVSKQNEKYY